MTQSVQSSSGYRTLLFLLDLFEKYDRELTRSEIEEELCACGPQAPSVKETMDVLEAYSSDTIACPSDSSAVLCLFQDLGDGSYALLADGETIAALRQHDNSFVSPDVLSVSSEKIEVIGTDKEDKADRVRTGLYDQAFYEASDDPQLRAQSKDGRYHADYSAYVINADLSSQSDSDRTMRSVDIMPDDTASLLDESNAALVRARERAEAAEQDAANQRARVDSLQAQNDALSADATKKQSKASRKIRKAQDRIDQQNRKIDDHNEQIDHNTSGMMKSMHRAQIRHDRKVIDRKKRKIARLSQPESRQR